MLISSLLLISVLISFRTNKTADKKTEDKVNKMTNLNNSEQIILITTKGCQTNLGEIRLLEKRNKDKWNQVSNSTAYIGKKGLTDNKQEGDQKSPTGKYTIGHAFGYRGNPGTKLSFKKASPKDVWVDDSKSKFYNTWQQKNNSHKDWNSAEEMTHELYKYGFIINYNTARIPGKGSAIFMHTVESGVGYTSGCVATNESDLIKVMKWINPDKEPVIILTPESELGNY